jgi:4a-hydroxytetrahydrobiopterin dehydratase
MNTSVCDLAAKTCKPCEGGVLPLEQAGIDRLLKELKGWEQSGKEIAKTFRFKNYHETMAFVNASAWISHREDHHPDLAVSYNQCRVRYSTHAIGGLSENDFICAAKIDSLFLT